MRGPHAALEAAVEMLATAPSPRSLEQTIQLTWQGAEHSMESINRRPPAIRIHAHPCAPGR
jgi:hypothetical protein